MASRGSILITGGAGYIGSHCAKAVAEAGFVPVVYDNLSTGHRNFVQWGPLVIGDVAEQLLGTLPSDAVRLNAEAVEVRPTTADGDPGGSSSKIVALRDGASVESRSGVVIVATSGPDAERLAGMGG